MLLFMLMNLLVHIQTQKFRKNLWYTLYEVLLKRGRGTHTHMDSPLIHSTYKDLKKNKHWQVQVYSSFDSMLKTLCPEITVTYRTLI
jgi:hypothetical protein